MILQNNAAAGVERTANEPSYFVRAHRPGAQAFRSSRILCAWAILASYAWTPTTGIAAPDDEEITAEAAAAAQRDHVVFGNENFEQWVFQGTNNSAAAYARLQLQAGLRLAEINRTCQLSVGQKRKLELAMQGDLQGFQLEVARVRRKFDALNHDQNVLGNIWQEIQALQRTMSEGLAGHDSLLMKVLSKTLNAEQAAAYSVVLAERRKFRYRASIASSLITMEAAIPLAHKEREAISKLLLEESQPPLTSGQYDHYLVMYRLANLPEAKLRPLFDPRRWQLLKEQFNQYRGMQAFLVEQGVLAAEEAGAGQPNSPPAATVEPAAVEAPP